ncbi:MAG: hypothetical protein U9O91_08520, partial [Candidatus Caldatribacteriota bacterium]|nr:hypothetical protein [Candidatus Caldatribacteriota bacterium]
YIHLGEEYLEKDEYKEVKYYIFQAEKIFEELEDKLGLADVYKLKAKLYKKYKKWEDSEIFFKKAIKIYSRFGDKINEGESYYEWGNILIIKKEFMRAQVKLNKAKKILQEVGTKRFIEDINESLDKIKNLK